MKLLIVGDGPEEASWAQAVDAADTSVLLAACPGFKARPELPGGADLDQALALVDVEGVIVGGGPDLRMEALRRVAGAGLPALVLHPPGENADPYYQVALSKQETGAVVVPDLPARLHPGVDQVRQALVRGELGDFRSLRLEGAVSVQDGDLLADAFPRLVDVVRDLLGEIEAVTATGDPPGAAPTESLVVQLRGSGGRRGELRLDGVTAATEPLRLTATGTQGSLTLAFEPRHAAPSRLTRSTLGREPVVEDLPAWDPKAAVLRVFEEAASGRAVHPDLIDGTRAMEIAEAVARSLRRGRTVDLLYEEVSEVGNFKSVMTSLGCLLLVATLLAVPLALAGAALGLTWMRFLAYLVPIALGGFLILQLLRFAIRGTAAGRDRGQSLSPVPPQPRPPETQP